MNKFQNVKFKNIDEFMDYLPDNERIIVDELRNIVLENIPGCIEKLAYNVPYYYSHSRICFIWPAAVPWGKVRRNGVLFGFCRGHLLHDDLHWLETGARKQVYTKTFLSIHEIQSEKLKMYIHEAVLIDEKQATR